MAKNKSSVEIQKQAEKRFERTKRKEKVKENRKIIKEFNRQERNARLPGFIITIIVFILFVGIFTGLYTNYNYKLELNPKEYQDIDISDSSEVLSARIENSFVDFFIALSDISNMAAKGISFLSTYDTVSDNPEVDTYLKRLQADSKIFLKNNYGFFRRFTLTQELGYYIDSFGNPDVSYTAQGLDPGVVHVTYAHNRSLEDISLLFGWDVEQIHSIFVKFNICHFYNGELYHYCHW